MSKEPKTESVEHTEDRRAKIKAESERLDKEAAKADAARTEQQAKADLKADDAEIEHIQKQISLISDGETRDELLERVRKLRGEVVEKKFVPPPPSPFMAEQIRIEQECGRQAVAKAEAEIDKFRAARKAMEEETRAREGTMTTVHHPNPGQQEQFPADKATMGKTK